MAKLEPLGIKKIEALHFCVRDLERSRSSKRRGASAPRCSRRAAASSWSRSRWGRAAGLSRKTADASPFFSITTPFGDTTFRFVERQGYPRLYPGFVPHETPRGGTNAFGFSHFDHLTSNFRTLRPMQLWMEEVMGFEKFWQVQFHTDDVAGPTERGSGLRSVVLWDPHSGVKLANNEPLRPHFRASQIHLFVEDHRGEGVQHAALAVRDIIPAVRGMRERGARFMPTPGTYYDLLPARLELVGVGRIDEDLEVLRSLEILVDGAKPRSYLLQIFLREFAGLFGDPEGGPFFFEIIQRKGDRGFGEGNFRALFESIERQQMQEGRI